jgi:cytochrome c-type biogenesis protein CcmH/NrfF
VKTVKITGILFLLAFISLNGADEALIEDLEQNLMAPCCWSGTVADHGHSEMESSIREMVSQGLTRQQVLDKFVAIYGEKILAIPKAEGFNLTAWIMPAVVFVLGVLIMILYFTNGPTKVALTQQKQNIRHSDQIEQELMEMD